MIEYEKVLADFSASIIDGVDKTYAVDREKAFQALSQLKLNGFDLLTNLTALDYPDKIQCVYFLQSYDLPIRLIIKVDLDRTKPNIDSVTSLWSSANWMEREAYDMFGIVFNNHPKLDYILIPEEVQGKSPLRKDFIVESSRR